MQLGCMLPPPLRGQGLMSSMNFAQDFFTLATIAALLWLFASAFYELDKIK